MNNSALFLLVIILVAANGKSECKKTTNEKLSFFLINHEITEIVKVPERPSHFKSVTVLSNKRSFQFTAFGNTFVVDLSIFFPREDVEVDYISKLLNSSDTFLDYNVLIYQGYVRNIINSSVLGSFGKENSFRGYVITDEILCIEPYDSDKVIVYRFKDVITPGCVKSSEDENLDCFETRYFVPWKANKAPTVKPVLDNYNLFYNKHFELYRQLQAKKAKLNKENYQKNDSSAEKHHGGESGGHHKPDLLSDSEEDDEKEKSKILTEYLRQHNRNRNKESKIRSKSDYSRLTNTTSSEEKLKDDKQKKDKKKGGHHDADDYDDDDEDENQILKDTNRFSDENNIVRRRNLMDMSQISTTETYRSNEIDSRKKMKQPYKNKDLSDMRKKPIMKRGLKSYHMKPMTEALKGDPIEALQCNVQVVVSSSFLKKFDEDTERIIKDVIIQFTLLNKIFLKLPLQRKGETVHFTVHVAQIIMLGDEVYSPFTERADLEYFTKSSRSFGKYCLTVGLTNQYLRSGDFFDGYIPEGKGGICSKIANTIILSHGNDRTPAPMALFFAALVRGITRAMGANDKSEECEEGTFPNPMMVLQDYILTQEIVPSSGYSIFTSCNVKEIEKELKARNCFYRVSQPLCGNAILDPGEECDCGPNAKCSHLDVCCNSPNLFLDPKSDEKTNSSVHRGCTLIEGAECSDSQGCCEGCEIAKSTEICISGPLDCDLAECDGKSASCPTGVEASDGIICSTNTTLVEPVVCKERQCDYNLCSSSNLEVCTCALGTKKECLYCCVKDGKCQAVGEDLKLFSNKSYFLPDDTECMGGLCKQGACTRPNGLQIVYNETSEIPPEISVSSFGTHFEYSRLYIIIETVASLFVLFLLKF